MIKIRIFIFLLIFAIAVPTTLSAHILPGGNADHPHGDVGEHTHDPYESDPSQPIHSKLAECAAIYDSGAKYGQQLDNFLTESHKEQLSNDAKKLKDKAVVIARKKDQEEPEQFIAAAYNKVHEIWAERWHFKEDEIHYNLVSENQTWLNYCKELGISMNIFSQFPNDPE